MALLSFRLSIVFTIGLLLLNGFASVSSVLAFVNEEGPERLRLIAAPPSHVIVTGSRNSPVYLPCQAELGPDTSEDVPNSSYGDDYLDEHNDEDDEEDEDDEGYDEETDEIEDDFLPHTSTLLTNNDLATDEQVLSRLQQVAEQQQQQHQQSQHYPRQYNDYDGDYEERRRRRRRRRRRKRYVHTQRRGGLGGGEYYGSPNIFEYVWYRNGLEFLTTSFQNQNLRQTHKGFRLFENGTLRIPYNRQNGNMAAGVYRCMASLANQHQHRYHGQASILSTECTVSIAYLERDNRINYPNNTITVRAREATVLSCPFQSYPPANITWSVNKTVLQLQTHLGTSKENRFYLLQNGSLLISNVLPSDGGRYRCNATNNYVTKNVRSTSVNVAVLFSSSPLSSLTGEASKRLLLPPLQPLQLSVRVGETLRLHCACYHTCKPQWIFTPRQSQIPIALDNFTHQVTFPNVSVERHEGVFTCRTPDATDRQTFNVTVLVPPAIVSKIASYTSSVVASMALNCTATGNPMPTVTWYKNGRELSSNYIVHYNYPMLRINTLDPEDEGLYQCVARNAAGEVSASSYLTIRDKQKYRHKAKRLDAIRCYPADTTSLYLTFAVPPHASANIEYVMYYLASDDPFRWFSSPPTLLATNGSLRISGRMVEPFRNYTVFLRACSVSDISGTENIRGSGTPGMKKVIPSRLSRGVRCASQGYPILSAFFPNNGIFIWWPKYDFVQPTAFTIQLRHGGNSNLTTFTNQIIGTVDPLDDYMSHEEVEPMLGKIDAETKELQDWLWNDPNTADAHTSDSADGTADSQQSHPTTPSRRRRQNHRDDNRRNRHAYDISKDRKQIFDSLATSSAVDVDVPIPVSAADIRSGNASSDIEAAVAAAKLSAATLERANQHDGNRDDQDAHEHKGRRQITITQVKVAGNVTGILLPNIRSVMVRVLGSIAPDGEPMAQDLRYVEWKVIDTDAPRTDAVNRFQTSHIDARSVQFTWSRFVATKAINRCLQLCYKNVNHDFALRGGSSRFDCQKIPKDASHYNLKDLLPANMYKAFLKPCEAKEALSAILDFQTKHDVPGPVTNHELHRTGGTISVTWGPPENRNGILQGYLVEWINEDSVQHSANLSADAVSFTFPNVTSDERINISLRALSSSGLGIPIYLNLKNYEATSDGGETGDDGHGSGGSGSVGYSDRWLFQLYLIVLVLLLFGVMGICCYLVFRRKACKKANAAAGAGAGAAGALNNRAPITTGSDGRHHLALDASAMQMMGMISGCNNDMHEMQTLIRTTGNYPHGANGGVIMANGVGLPLSTYGQSLPGTGPIPVAALITTGKRQSTFKGRRDGATTNVQLNVGIPLAVNECNDITSYKELLGKEREFQESPISNSSGCSTNADRFFSPRRVDGAAVIDSAAENSATFSRPNSIPAKREHSAPRSGSITSNGTFKQQNYDEITSAAVINPMSGEHKQSPNLSFTSKTSRAAAVHSSPSSSSSSSSSSSCSSSTPSSLSPASSHGAVKRPKPLELDSSQRRLLETTLDSNTSTTNVEEAEEEEVETTAPLPSPPPTPPPPPHPVELYDYDYATNCDEVKEEERDHSQRPMLVRQQAACRTPEVVSNCAPPRTISPPLVLVPKPTTRGRVLSLPNNETHQNHCQRRRPEAADTVAAEHGGTTTYMPRTGVDMAKPVPHPQPYHLNGDEDDEDDDDELDNSASLLNASSLSTKPLHQQTHTSSWNFRRPIIGPNG